jgi:arylsulfatase A-like enzyme
MAELRPNVVLMICHDLGRRLGCYGLPGLQTPNFDRLAAAGIRFTQQFSTCPLCSPSRGSIVTGCYPHNVGLNGLVNRGWDMVDGVPTLPQLLAGAGYETALFGMQHEKQNPLRMGYGRYLHAQPPHLAGEIAPLVADYVAARRPDDRPFFANIATFETHRPFKHARYTPDDPASVDVPPYLPDHPAVREDLADFHGLIHAADAAVGQILDAIERSPIGANTLFIFTTDHGIAFPRAKSTLYDSGIGTALLMRWPAHIAAGRVSSALLSNVDLAPTILDCCNVPPSPSAQGRSYAPLLAGQGLSAGAGAGGRQEIFAEKTYHDVYDPRRVVRTARWSYIRNFTEGPALPLPTDIAAGLSATALGPERDAPRPPEELYDLQADPHQLHNLAADPAHTDTKAGLRLRLDAWQEQTGDPLLRGVVPEPPQPVRAGQRARG